MAVIIQANQIELGKCNVMYHFNFFDIIIEK